MSKNYCYALGCYKSNISKANVFRFPRDEQRCEKWVRNCGNERLRDFKALDLNIFARLCGLHFERSQFMNDKRNRLVHNAVPTIFSHELHCLSENLYDLLSDSAPPTVDTSAQVCQSPGETVFPTVDNLSGDSVLPGKAESPPTVDTSAQVCQSPGETVFPTLDNLSGDSALPGKAESPPTVESSDEACPSSGTAESVENLCRLCTEPAGVNAVNLFVEKYLGRKIFAMLNTLLPDTFTEIDGLSQLVCSACVNEVNICYNTVQAFVFADKKLKDMLKDRHKGEQLEPQCETGKTNTSHVANHRSTELVKCHVKIVRVLKSDLPQYGSTVMCSCCKKLFTDPYMAEQHRSMKCKGSANFLPVKFKCPCCNKIFSRKCWLLRHKRVHTNPPQLLICHVCGKTMKNISTLKHHLFYHKNKDSKWKPDLKSENICPICGKIFKLRGVLNTHIHTHETKPLLFVCYMCGAVLKSSVGLRSHEKRHLYHVGPKPWPFCKNTRRYKSRLQTHIKAQTGRIICLCHVCGAHFCSKKGFRLHLRKHMNLNTILPQI